MKLILAALITVSILHVNAQSTPKIEDPKTNTANESLQQVVNNYNRRIAWWDKDANLIELSKPIIIEATKGDKMVANKDNNFMPPSIIPTVKPAKSSAFNDKSLIEIVVTTAMGIKKPLNAVGTSIATLKGREVNQGKVTNLATGLAAKVSGLQVSLVNNGVKADTRVTLRGDRSILGNNQALLVVDDVELPISYISSLNPNDVDNVTILKGASASALYGSDASNGVIIVTTQKGKATSDGSVWRKYKLEDAEDVDYMRKIQRASPAEYLNVYGKLEKENSASLGFYLDMADFFFQKGMEEKATAILKQAIEVNGGTDGLIAIAYTFESHRKFDEAINIYKNIIEKNNDAESVKRDLALAWFQNGNYQLSLNTYYAIIARSGDETTSINSIKQIAMDEMNALIALHSDNLDLTAINLRLVRPLPVDLRIVLESNDRNPVDLLVKEPGDEVCNAASPNSSKGGHLSSANYDRENNFYDYSIKNAPKGEYGIITNAYNSYPNIIPHMVRIITFKNFQKPGQTIEIKNVILDNQYGEVEIAAANW